MSVSLPLIANLRDEFLGALPFVHTRARNQCINAIRRAFGDTTGKPKSVRVMLHLSTRHGPTMMEMRAYVLRCQSELHVILIGREVDPSLVGLVAGLIHAEGPVTGSAVPLSESNDVSCFRPISKDGCDTNLTVDERGTVTNLTVDESSLTNQQMHHNDDHEVAPKISSLTVASTGSVGSAARGINSMLGFT